MQEVRLTLVGDGRFDSCLVRIVDWLVHDLGVEVPIQSTWADLDKLPRATTALVQRIGHAVALYPCDLLFVHRDAENRPSTERVTEIDRAIVRAARTAAVPAHVAVVPVRMTEAWLLFDERLVRQAAGNPGGTQALRIPRRRWDSVADPKQVLHAALLDASGLNNRRRAAFPVAARASRIAELATDFSPLRALQAFRDLEEATSAALRSFGLI